MLKLSNSHAFKTPARPLLAATRMSSLIKYGDVTTRKMPNEKWIPANFGTSLQKTKAIFGKSIKNSIMCQMENASQKVPVTLNLWIPSRGTFCVIDFDETLLEKFASVEKMSPVCVIKNVSLLKLEQKMG